MTNTNHYSILINNKTTSQQSQVLGRSDMTQNNAGGYVFQVDDWTRLDRFLILGSAQNTYYQSRKALTKENAEAVVRCLALDGVKTVNRIVEISHQGRAPRNDEAVFALAMAMKLGNTETRRYAQSKVSDVCRIGTHLFHLARDIQAFGGWGRGTKRAIGQWYQELPVAKLALQSIKYQQRDGWSHRDLLRLAHPKTRDRVRNGLFGYIVKGDVVVDQAKTQFDRVSTWQDLRILDGFEKMKEAETVEEVLALLVEYPLPRECIPTQFLNDPRVWEALLETMPMTALVRNLGKMTAVGLLTPLSASSKHVVTMLEDVEAIKRSRVHPLTLLMAQAVYRAGRGIKGGLSWTPDAMILAALEDAFYSSFGNVTPTGKNFMIGVDVSGSMNSPIANSFLSCRTAAAAMAMMIARTEQQSFVMAFDHQPRYLPITAKTSLQEAINLMQGWRGGGTDCALPMLLAVQEKLNVDIFVTLTDNETWYGSIHPFQALQQYRQRSGRAAKNAVFAMTATPFSIADPTDGGMMDFVGFDAGALTVFNDFCRDGNGNNGGDDGDSDE